MKVEHVHDDGSCSECARLRRELEKQKREVRQMLRVAESSETIAEQSKRAMLRTHSDLRRLVEELRAAKQSAEAATQAKSRFLAVMTHELRTPLHGMIGSADLLMAMPLEGPQRELVELLRRSGSALLTIVNDILDYSRVEAGMLQMEVVPFRPAPCLQAVLDLQAAAKSSGGLRLRCEVDPAVPTWVAGDEGRLRQVLNNLVNNAVKFTPNGEVVLSVAPAEFEDQLRFTVRDTGVGIAPAALPRLFQAFVQEDVSTTRRFGGTGLGLAICKRLVQLLGGDIQVQSEPGKGSSFSFTCRLPRVAEPAGVETVGTPVAAALPFAARKILVVDDHEANRLLMRRMLERLGCEIEEASDGAEAVNRILGAAYDLVLMDCSMPVLDGYAATKQVRQHEAGARHVPIVALTANAQPEDRERCREAGMDGYLGKPVRLALLQGELARFLTGPGPGDVGPTAT
jgi:signal transduction histidine kinase